MKIKVCGMKYPDNIRALGQLPIDYMGLIFYSKSPRGIKLSQSKPEIDLPNNVKRVGVFVNEELDIVRFVVAEYKLDCIQLHGKESSEYCKAIAEASPNVEIIKAFSIADREDFETTSGYEEVCDYFLFDTKTPQHGGSGQKFDWSILNSYQGNIPFLLSGGISKCDVEAIKNIQHSKLVGVDLNSRFEVEPGLKDIEDLKQFITQLRS